MKEIKRTNSICPPPEETLFNSVKINDSESIKTLIKSNPNLSTYTYPYDRKTILIKACELKEVEASTIETLIELGSDLKGNDLWKPLHTSALNPNTAILKTIIDKLEPGQINDTLEGNTALLYLVKNESVNGTNEEEFCGNVEELLKAGINVNQTDGKNLTAVVWAAKKGYKAIVRTILDKSINHVDIDTHKLAPLKKSARDLILEKKLYYGALPGQVLIQIPEEKILFLIKSGTEDDFINYFNTLENPHAFLDLDDGTTLLQYCAQKGLAKVAKFLVERGADINKTQNNPKAPFALAAEYGYHEIVEVLLKESGVQITPNILCGLLKHSDHIKSDKINHEKCYELILDYLESGRIKMDINEKDDLTNTCIHYSLRYCDENTSKRILNLGASLASKNKYDIMPIQDIKPELLEHHLDDCIEFNIKNNNDEKRDFEVVFNYNSLLPPMKTGRNKFEENDSESLLDQDKIIPESEVIAYMSTAPEFRQLLKHPVIVTFLFMKWHKIRLLFYINLFFYILFVASLVSYIFAYYTDFDLTDSCNTFCVALNLTFWILVLRELFQVAASPTNYFKNFENFVEIILIFITAVILYVDSSYDLRKQLASLAILLSAFELILMVGQHPKLSTNVVMFKTVSVNFFKLLLWYSLLIIAFALSFYILFAKPQNVESLNQTQSDEDDLFMGPGKSLFKTIVMLTGEFDAGSIDFHTYPITSKIIFSLFVFMITIILLNLLNGLAVSDTQTIKNDAELVGHIARAQHIYYVESMLLGNIVPTYFRNALQKLFCCWPEDFFKSCTFLKPLGKRVRLFPDLTNSKLSVWPNNHGKISYEYEQPVKRSPDSEYRFSKSCRDIYLDKETVRKINAIVKLRRDPKERHYPKDLLGYDFWRHFEKLSQDIADLKSKLDIIEKRKINETNSVNM